MRNTSLESSGTMTVNRIASQSITQCMHVQLEKPAEIHELLTKVLIYLGVLKLNSPGRVSEPGRVLCTCNSPGGEFSLVSKQLECSFKMTS